MENTPITEKTETLGQAFGRLGGLATARTHNKAHYQQMALKSALVRRLKSKKTKMFDVSFKSTS